MANSVDPDQTAHSGAVSSGSTLFPYAILSDTLVFEFLRHLLFVCVEVLWPNQPSGVMSSAVSLPNHTFTGQA